MIWNYISNVWLAFKIGNSWRKWSSDYIKIVCTVFVLLGGMWKTTRCQELNDIQSFAWLFPVVPFALNLHYTLGHLLFYGLSFYNTYLESGMFLFSDWKTRLRFKKPYINKLADLFPSHSIHWFQGAEIIKSDNADKVGITKCW